ncbi:MAG: septal ring lytic transglycosylase RlpA family lipoprotein, partial [Gammaproteobacteria bacterium]
MRVSLHLLVATGLLLAGCSSKPGTSAKKAEEQDGPPLVVPAGLANLPDPEVRHERPTKRGNPKSYTVFGKTYYVMNSAAGYDALGNASW